MTTMLEAGARHDIVIEDVEYQSQGGHGLLARLYRPGLGWLSTAPIRRERPIVAKTRVFATEARAREINGLQVAKVRRKSSHAFRLDRSPALSMFRPRCRSAGRKRRAKGWQ
jgi:hypothetical protein